MTLNADGTGVATFTGGTSSCMLQQAAPWFVTCEQEAGGSEDFTWTFENGNVVIVFEDGDELSSPIGAGGRIVIFGGTTEFQPGAGFSNIGIAIRLPNP